MSQMKFIPVYFSLRLNEHIIDDALTLPSLITIFIFVSYIPFCVSVFNGWGILTSICLNYVNLCSESDQSPWLKMKITLFLSVPLFSTNKNILHSIMRWSLFQLFSWFPSYYIGFARIKSLVQSSEAFF